MLSERQLVPEPEVSGLPQAEAAPKAPARVRRPPAQGRARDNTAVVRSGFAALTAISDLAAIVASALAAGWLYHYFAYDSAMPMEAVLRQGYVLAVVFVVPNVLRSEYSVNNYLSFDGHMARVFTIWNIAFVSAILIAFMTKTLADVSRGATLVFYFGGFGLLALTRLCLVRILRDRTGDGGVAARRIFLVGHEADVIAFQDRHDVRALGLKVVSAAILRGPGSLEDDLALAAASARVLRPDDIFILTSWGEKRTIEAAVDAFLRVPAAIHLGSESLIERFRDVRFERVGPISSLHLVRRPLSTMDIVLKRIFDLTLASIALVLLAPMFVVMGLLIKLDSKGPVFFLQRRYGFNQEPFRIWKFRSMTSMDDGRVVKQATANDARITRMGRFMRSTNIDELPQLINVIKGEMSLVGPRPHALAHDQQYERTIALYARRHNVRPGITGWAQVSGLRGETNTEIKMRRRVEFDLYYIDNWSFLFDMKIIWLTVFSRKAYRNAL